MKTTLIGASIIAVTALLGTLVFTMTTIQAVHAASKACAGNPHDADAPGGNPHDNGENGNPHDTTVQTHHGPNPEADICPGAK
jgi:Spy/CpxP family protein refolding chaperone